jgi:DNA repair exonuclease SbcCD ATPase subunit
MKKKIKIIKKQHNKIYTGSTIAQNHGETDDKGFLIWEITDKNTFDVRHIVIPNPRPFITIKLDQDGKFDETLVVPKDARIRVIVDTNIGVQDIRKSIDIIKVKFNPESVSFLNKATERIDISNTLETKDVDNLRDIQTQEMLLTEYLKDFNPTKDILDKVFELNKKYNTLVEENEEVSRNIRWSLKNIKWDNLFNYGQNNSIDFEKLHGVVGIFGKNFSGKSSIIDSLLWGIQNSTSKNVRKNVNIINQNQTSAKAVVDIIVDNKQYTIERTAEKYTKKLGGEEVLEAKTDVSFSVCDAEQTEDCVHFEKGNLNGLDRNETDKNIRKIFGTLEDFLFTSMSSQMGSLDFINEGSTRRKEILGKFLDLDIFAKKHKLSNNEATELKAALKRLEGKDYEKELTETLLKGSETKKQSQQQASECELIKEDIRLLTEQINSIDIEVASLPKIEVVDIEDANKTLDRLNKEVLEHASSIKENTSFINDKQAAIDNSHKVLKDLNIDDANTRKNTIIQKNKDLDKLLRQLTDVEKDLKQNNKDTKILEEVPCGDKFFTTCKFLTNANKAKENIPEEEKLISIINNKKTQAELEIANLKLDEVEKVIAAYNLILEKRRNMESIVSAKKLEVEKLNNKIILINNFIVKLQKNIEVYSVNEEVALKLKDLADKKNVLCGERTKISKKLAECEASLLKLYKEYGSLEQKYIDIEEMKNEMLKLREEYTAIAMFEKAMHSNGISYDVIRKKLPIINQEISKILTNIVNFEIFFEDDGKKLEINIKHPKYDARPIELGSGAEKSLAAMTIRLALTKITSLPVGDIMILDEPATALDEENMEGFIRILDMLKNHYKTIILISHLPELKDIADTQIVIDNVDGYAHVEI